MLYLYDTESNYLNLCITALEQSVRDKREINIEVTTLRVKSNQFQLYLSSKSQPSK